MTERKKQSSYGFAAPEPSYITGQAITVDGGYTAM